MPLSLKFRLAFREDKSSKASRILSQEMKGGLEAVGKRLITSARSRMRRDTGEEHKSLVADVTGTGLNLKLEVYSTLMQAFIDAYGLRAGVRPPYAVGTRLYKWASRKAKGVSSRKVTTYHVPPHVGPAPNGKKKSLAKAGRKRRLKAPRQIKRVSKGKGGVILKARARRNAKNNNVARLAFLVSRAIFRKGIKGTQWNYKTLQANQQRIVRELSNAVARAANKMTRG